MTRRQLTVTLLIGLAMAAFLVTQFEVLREYKLYFTEDRKDATFQLLELSEDWSERYLRERFSGFPVRCYPNPGEGLGDVGCIIDTKSYNGTPALFISFFFVSGKLHQVSINIPWWKHDEAFGRLKGTFGVPTASQASPHSGVRLHGWQLPSGAGVFYNRDASFNPLQWNAIYWRSSTSCRTDGCFRQ
jgi:hypothetical protein